MQIFSMSSWSYFQYMLKAWLHYKVASLMYVFWASFVIAGVCVYIYISYIFTYIEYIFILYIFIFIYYIYVKKAFLNKLILKLQEFFKNDSFKIKTQMHVYNK